MVLATKPLASIGQIFQQDMSRRYRLPLNRHSLLRFVFVLVYSDFAAGLDSASIKLDLTRQYNLFKLYLLLSRFNLSFKGIYGSPRYVGPRRL